MLGLPRGLESRVHHVADGHQRCIKTHDAHKICAQTNGLRTFGDEPGDEGGSKNLIDQHTEQGKSHSAAHGKFGNRIHALIVFSAVVKTKQRDDGLGKTQGYILGDLIHLVHNAHGSHVDVPIDGGPAIDKHEEQADHQSLNSSGDTGDQYGLENLFFQEEIPGIQGNHKLLLMLYPIHQEENQRNGIGQEGCQGHAQHLQPEHQDKQGVQDDV